MLKKVISQVGPMLKGLQSSRPTLSDVVAGPNRKPDSTSVPDIDRQKLGKLAKLPPFRPLVISMLRLFDRADVEVDEVSALLETDPAVASELLAYSNSALFGVRSKVASVSHAVTLLGIEQTRSVIAMLAMRALMDNGPKVPVVRRFWMHSMASATIAYEMAPILGLSRELGHTSAMLHDLGRMGLLAAHTTAYSAFALKAHESTQEIEAGEKALFGMDHCEAGLLLAKAWGLPPVIQESALLHHFASKARTNLVLVQMSCRLADALKFQSVMYRKVLRPAEVVEHWAPEGKADALLARIQTVEKTVIEKIQALDI